MARRTRPRATARSSRRARPAKKRRTPERPRFVGRDASPILDRYPPKDPGLAPRGPAPAAPPVPPAPAATPSPSAGAGGPAAPPVPLLSLERPFSVDEFAAQLGANALEVTVPREDLAEVLKRVSEFMGFGIYVYEVQVRPAASESLRNFVVRLQRVDYRPEHGGWAPFEERGRSDSPFGPEGHR